MKWLKHITVAVLVLSLLGHLLLWGSVSQWTYRGGSGYGVFALLPCLVLLLYIVTPGQEDGSAKRVGLLVTSLFIGPYPVLVYYRTLFSPLSSTSGLVFVLLPLYCFIAMPFIYWATQWVYFRAARKR